MLRRAALLLVLIALSAAGCSIDRVEWETSGFPVEDVAHVLEEEHHASDPAVECIQREVQGAEWECRARSPDAEYHCHVTANQPRERIYEVHCESGHEEEASEEAEHDAEPGAEPAETEPSDDGH
jgi:hypothetical protein